MRLFPVSAMYTFPTESTATLFGELRGSVGSIVTVPVFTSSFLMRLFPVSATYKFPT